MSTALALLLLRSTLGAFYVLARFRFFYDPSMPTGRRLLNRARHASLARKMCHCGLTAEPYLWAWLVAVIEVGAGLFLLAGYQTRLAAFGLLVLTCIATYCTAREKVAKQHPCDRLDWYACYLWCAEPLYIVLAVCVLLLGAGDWSADTLLSYIPPIGESYPPVMGKFE